MVRSDETSRVGRGAVAAVLSLLALLPAACGDDVDVKQALQIGDVTTGWYDAGLVGRKNKLVPSVSFRVKNVADETIRSVQLNAVFRVVGDAQELGSMLVKGIDTNGLPPGQTSPAFTLRSSLGYTGEQPRLQMLQHSQFKDAKVEIFAKHGGKQWVKLGEFNVDRQLLTH